MQILPIDVTALVGTILGISIVLVPVIGLTARFALKPAVQAISQLFDHQSLGETVRVLERRIDFQEHQIEALESSMRRLTEGSDFDRQLLSASAREPGAMPDPSSGTPRQMSDSAGASHAREAAAPPSNRPTSSPTDEA